MNIGRRLTNWGSRNIRNLTHVPGKNSAFSDQQEIWLKIIGAKKHTGFRGGPVA